MNELIHYEHGLASLLQLSHLCLPQLPISVLSSKLCSVLLSVQAPLTKYNLDITKSNLNIKCVSLFFRAVFFKQDLTRLPSKEHVKWQQTRSYYLIESLFILF